MIPYDEFEPRVIGSLLFGSRHTDSMRAILAGCEWGEPALADAYAAICTLIDTQAACVGDPVAMTAQLLPMLRGYDRSHIVSLLTHCAESCTSPELGQVYAQELRERSQRRSLRALGAKLIDTDESDKVADVLDLVDVHLHTLQGNVFRPAEQAEAVAERLLGSYIRGDRRAVATVGIQNLGGLMGGLHAGELCTIAARTGCGKTSLAMQLALHNSEQGRPTLFVSMEMSGEDLLSRVIAAQVPFALRGQRLSEHEADSFRRAVRRLRDVPLYVWDTPRATVQGIRAQAKYTRAKAGLSLLVVDYIQICQPTDSRASRVEQIGQITGGLKELSKELGCATIALCQLNRLATRETPTLAHLRESGSIEQDSDLVLLLYGDDAAQDPNILPMRAHLAKNRRGATGMVYLEFHRQETRFIDPHQWDEELFRQDDDVPLPAAHGGEPSCVPSEVDSPLLS